MTFEPTQKQLAFVLPASILKADLTFTRRSGTAEDVYVPIQPGSKPRQVVSTAQLAKGTWLAQLNWSVGRLHYYHEKVIVVV